MANMYGEDVVTDLASAAGAVLVPYLLASWAKDTGVGADATYPVLTGVALGIGGVVVASSAARRPMTHEIAEGIGYGSLGFVGTALAANTTTLGNKGPGAIPMNVGIKRPQAVTYARSFAATPVVTPRTPQFSYPGYNASLAGSFDESPLSASSY